MADEFAALRADLAEEHAELDRLVASLSETQWSVLTPADGWTVRDTIVHLAVTDDVAALAAADSAGFEAYRRERQSGTDRLQSNRNLPASTLLELWRANRQRLLDALGQLGARARITWFGPPMSAMSHATARLMETWAHGQDIVDALELQRTPTARLKHVAHLGVRTRAYSFTQNELSPPTGDVRVELQAPDGSLWTWGDPTAEDRVHGSAADFCLVVVQRRHLDDTHLDCSGPHAREWLLIAQAFAGRAGGGRKPGQFPRATRI